MIDNNAEKRNGAFSDEKFVMDFLFENGIMNREDYYTNEDRVNHVFNFKGKNGDTIVGRTSFNNYTDDIVKKDFTKIFDLEGSFLGFYKEKKGWGGKKLVASCNYFKFFDNIYIFDKKLIASYIKNYIKDKDINQDFVEALLNGAMKDENKNNSLGISWSFFAQKIFKELIVMFSKKFYNDESIDTVYKAFQHQHKKEMFYRFTNRLPKNLFTYIYEAYESFLDNFGIKFDKILILHKKNKGGLKKDYTAYGKLKVYFHKLEKSCFDNFEIKVTVFNNVGNVNVVPYIRTESKEKIYKKFAKKK